MRKDQTNAPIVNKMFTKRKAIIYAQTSRKQTGKYEKTHHYG